MSDFRKFIISKELEKASLEEIKDAILSESKLSSETKEFWIGLINELAITKDVADIIKLLNDRY